MTLGSKLSAARRIDSRGDLADLIKELAEAVCAGELHQITPTGAPFATTEDIRRISPEGPWPDYLELHFQDVQTDNRYKLVAETYHGRGGSWELVP